MSQAPRAALSAGPAVPGFTPALPPSDPVVEAHLAEGKDHRWGWIGKGAILLGVIVIGSVAASCVGLTGYYTRYTFAIGAVIIGVTMLVASALAPILRPKAPVGKRRGVVIALGILYALVWAALITMAVMFAAMVRFDPTRIKDLAQWAVLAVPVGAAAWLLLRGRSGHELWALIAPVVVVLLEVFVKAPVGGASTAHRSLAFMAFDPSGWRFAFGVGIQHRWFARLALGPLRPVFMGPNTATPTGGFRPWVIVLIQLSILLACFALPLVLAAWIAGIPALRRWEGRRLSKVGPAVIPDAARSAETRGPEPRERQPDQNRD
jgi:hypothetical protein